jgi:hypothetical protein
MYEESVDAIYLSALEDPTNVQFDIVDEQRESMYEASSQANEEQVVKTGMTGRAGEYYSAGEIHRRGGWAVTFSGNMPRIDLLASDEEHTRTVSVQVKARRPGTWHASTARDMVQRQPVDPEDRFWIFVDLSVWPPRFFVVPHWWMQNDIYDHHQAYLERHGGHRAINDASTHHAIQMSRVLTWEDRWNILGIGLVKPL